MVKKTLIALLELLAIIGIALLLIILSRGIGMAEDDPCFTAWVICQPNDFVNAREKPSRKSRECGYFLPGDPVETDGYSKNGYLRCYGFEVGVAWVSEGYVVYDKPERVDCTAYSVAKGRLAARKCIDGKRRCWVGVNEEVTVSWMSSEWCITNKGFVKTEFLEMEGE